MKLKTIFVLFCYLIAVYSVQANTAKTVFVQLFEWPWEDVARECEENLGPNGYAAVQVSPPQEHLTWANSPWWERYQVISYDIISRSGNEAQFKNMIKRCNGAGVDVYVDVVINHMAGMGEGVGFNGTTFSHYEYPQIFEYNDFHHCGRNGSDDIKDFNDLYELQFCELVNLADLKTESEKVRNQLAKYLNHLIDLGANGFRVDAVKHIPAKDIAAIVKKLKKPVYILQELITSGGDPINVSDYTKVGDVTAYAYPYMIGQIFKNNRFDFILEITKYMPDSMDSVVLIDNHDLQRSSDRSMLLSAQFDQVEFDLAQVFMLTYPFGYPQLYSSYKFNHYDEGPPVGRDLFTLPVLEKNSACKFPWLCEHKRYYVNNMVKFRNNSNSEFYVSNWWTNGSDQLHFSRGSSGFVAINNSLKPMKKHVQTGLKKGSYCNLYSEFALSKTCQKFQVNEFGFAQIEVSPKSAIVLQ